MSSHCRPHSLTRESCFPIAADSVSTLSHVLCSVCTPYVRTYRHCSWHCQLPTDIVSPSSRCSEITQINNRQHRSQWPRSLRRRSAAARQLRSWVRIPPGAWIFVCCECRVLSGRGLCDELITRPEESYLLWCVVVRDIETSRMRRP